MGLDDENRFQTGFQKNFFPVRRLYFLLTEAVRCLVDVCSYAEVGLQNGGRKVSFRSLGRNHLKEKIC